MGRGQAQQLRPGVEKPQARKIPALLGLILMWRLCAKMGVWNVLPTCLTPPQRGPLSVAGRFSGALLMWCLFVLCLVWAVLRQPGNGLERGFSLKGSSGASDFLFGAYLHQGGPSASVESPLNCRLQFFCFSVS